MEKMRRMKLKVAITILIFGLSTAVHGGASPKCSGLIGFSSSGVKTVHSTGLIKFNKNLVDSGHGWVSDTGVFTVICPGVYQISYTAYGTAQTKFTLQKRAAVNGAPWESIITTPPGGGTVSLLLSLAMAEQVTVKASGPLPPETGNTIPTTLFNAYKLPN